MDYLNWRTIIILTYFPEYFSTCPTEIVYTRGAQSHRCRKRASCSYVISYDQKLPNVSGYWETQRPTELYSKHNPVGHGLCTLGTLYRGYTCNTSSGGYSSYFLAINLATGNSIYSGDTVTPLTLSCFYFIKY